MNTRSQPGSSELIMACTNLDEAIEYLTGSLGFRLDTIFPADAPRTAVLSNADNRIRLELGADGEAPVLRVTGEASEPPAGLRIAFVDANDGLAVPPLAPSLVVRRARDGHWATGRAGMQYRDLLPTRLGGRFIASHIRIPDGGPVPDYVHYHRIRMQMIYCYRGWVRVVYEDQGQPFVMQAGDCVLQPPEIRHRVLECSAGFEVVEIGCPAEHETHVDHERRLPTAEVCPDRDFGGQRFVFHRAEDAAWQPWWEGFEARDTGIAQATRSLAGAVVVRPNGAPTAKRRTHDAEFVLRFVLSGQIDLHIGERAPMRLDGGDTVTIPAGLAYDFLDPSDDFEMLEVALPADYGTAPA